MYETVNVDMYHAITNTLLSNSKTHFAFCLSIKIILHLFRHQAAYSAFILSEKRKLLVDAIVQ